MTFDNITTTIGTMDDVEALFEAAGESDSFGWAEETIQWIRSRADARGAPRCPIQIAEGPLAVESLHADSPWILLVNGDLAATGDLDFATAPLDTCLLVVFGDVKARNLRYSHAAKCFISGTIELSGLCFGDHGQEAAALFAAGLTATAVLLDEATDVNVPLDRLSAVICSVEDWGLPMQIDYNDSAGHAAIFVTEALADGKLDLVAAWRLTERGEDLFLPGVLERLQVEARAGRD